ncbi:hypothetical protein [Sodalis sp. (in: enterobacteria)]|uniref:hypothetical protein n=1 Tax=Sodalis sp. (in: enterobacteria) TaxID=1898979 RepID=UPI00046C9361
MGRAAAPGKKSLFIAVLASALVGGKQTSADRLCAETKAAGSRRAETSSLRVSQQTGHVGKNKWTRIVIIYQLDKNPYSVKVVTFMLSP